MGKWAKRLAVSAAILAAVVLLCLAALSERMAVRRYDERSDKISDSVRFVVIADLHNCFYAEEQRDLVDAIEAQMPDAILFVGDIVDNFDALDGMKALLEQIGTAYPCFYVSGNHEYWTGKSEEINRIIRGYGVTVLEGESAVIEVRGQRVRIAGVDDPDGFRAAYAVPGKPLRSWQEQLDACRAQLEDDVYSILLSHRPERVDAYRDSGFDLVLAGHAHGGQVRIPGLLNGLYAPNQGSFPKYAGGRYELGGTAMIVSRGLAIGGWPRVCNRPELVVVELRPN